MADKFESWLVKDLTHWREVRDKLLVKKGLEPTQRNMDNLPVSELMEDDRLFRAMLEVRILEKVLQEYKRMKR